MLVRLPESENEPFPPARPLEQPSERCLPAAVVDVTLPARSSPFKSKNVGLDTAVHAILMLLHLSLQKDYKEKTLTPSETLRLI